MYRVRKSSSFSYITFNKDFIYIYIYIYKEEDLDYLACFFNRIIHIQSLLNQNFLNNLSIILRFVKLSFIFFNINYVN
jgi:hypothetical protein